MTSWSDLKDEGYRVPLDPDTADRLLAGALAPEDAPPGYAGVARLLDAAGATDTGTREQDVEIVALIAEAVRRSPRPDPSPSTPRRSFMPFAFTRPRLTAAVLAAGLACSTGLASAGALPGAAQDVAAAMLAKIGVSVPGPNENAGTSPAGSGSSPTVAPASAGIGAEISELATTTELTGVEKGAAISTAASGGKSKAGEQGGALTNAAVATPSTGGTEVADAASGGKSSSGTTKAGEKSGGKSAAGAANAAAGVQTAAEASGGRSERP